MIACSIVTYYKTVIVEICIGLNVVIVGLCNGSAIVMLMELTINYERECGRPSKACTTSVNNKQSQHAQHAESQHTRDMLRY